MGDRVRWLVATSVFALVSTTRAGDRVADSGIMSPVSLNNSEILPNGSNRTVVVNNVYSKDEVYDVLGMWESFSKVVTPRGGSEECRNASDLFLRSLGNFDLWALKMFDSTAKLPSGILSGNVNQYGDFDECLSVDDVIQGKYCLASIQLTHTIAHIDTLIHAHHYIRSNVTDMGHRVPRFSSIMWGVCIPSACSSQDLEDELALRLKGSGAQVRVESTMCSVRNQHMKTSLGKIITMGIIISLLSLLAMGTIFDNGSEGRTPFSKVLNAFSLRRNFKKLLDTSAPANTLPGVSGIRFLNALALLMVHKSMALNHMPMVNRTSMSESLSEPWTVIGRTAIIYTDSFLYVSGLLNAHQLFQELERKGTIDFKNRLISRWFRLFPLFLSLMLFCTYIMPDINNGPQWNLVVAEHSRVCQRNMWRSFLFIHNFFGFENMCLTHTHQIGMDMQLYLATPLFVWVIWKLPKLGWTLLLGSAVASTLLRYLAVYRHNVSMVVYFGISIQNLLDAARFSYILPHHRATVYLIGVAMAYILMSKRSKFQLSKAQSYLLWTTALALGFWCQMSPWRMGSKNYTYEHGSNATFAAFSPIIWGIWLSLAQWAVTIGHGGWFGDFLDCRLFKMFNKISYSVYLVQFPLYFYNVGVQRHAEYYSLFKVLYLPEIIMILLLSVITTLAIEMPFNEIYRHFFSKQKVKESKIKDT